MPEGDLPGGNEYEVRQYQESDQAAVVDLHRKLLRRGPGENDSYLRWKYEDNPYLGRPLLALVFHGDELVAMRGLYGTAWVGPDGGARVIPAAEDLIVADAHRNRGLFRPLDKGLRRLAAENGFESIISLTASPETRRLQEVSRWSRIGDLETVRSRPGSERIYPRAMRRARSAVRPRRGPGPPSRAEVDRIVKALTRSGSSVDASTNTDIETMTRTAGSRIPAGVWSQARTREFFEWRLSNPDRRYVYVSWNGEEVEAFLLVSVANQGRHLRVVANGAEEAGLFVEMVRLLLSTTGASVELLPDAVPAGSDTGLDALGFKRTPTQGDAPARGFYLWSNQDSPIGVGEYRIDLIDTMLG